ncbi:flavodoxin family protein [Oscillibacter sp. GMB15532]|uniref:flavodoxin family protein n=1 Tax=Oscillibacter sp. GMB15532 TaxID=3230022 RepID=UPI0034DE7C37
MNRVVYFSRGGNTKKLAEAIAKGAGASAISVEQFHESESANVLFVGGAIYAGTMDGRLREFLLRLAPSQVKQVVLFSTAAGRKLLLPEVNSILDPKGISVLDDEFHCKGSFLLANRGRPNEDDLKQAEAFARKICGNLS